MQHTAVVISDSSFKNNLLEDGKKVLIIRDSSACIVTPFLALNTSELHIVDIRDFTDFVGDKLDIFEYIKTVKPDYVLMLYTSIYSVEEASGRFDF